MSSERKRSGGAATPRSIDEEITSTTPDLPEGNDADKSAPVSLESIPAAVPTNEDEPYYDQVPVDINDGEYVYIQAGMLILLSFALKINQCEQSMVIDIIEGF